MVLIPFLAVVLLLALSGVRIAQEYHRGVVFRLGRLQDVRGPGLYWNIPLLEWQRIVDIRTQTVAIERQETITRDSVTIKVNAVVWYRIDDPARSICAVADYQQAVYQTALTTLRNIIGQHDLDEVLKERDQINRVVRKIVDDATDPWGLTIETIEMKDVEIPESMQRAMAREAEAIREKRARIIKAQAELEASERLSEASRQIGQAPGALELRRMQMITEVGAENNTTTIIMMPSDFVSLAGNVSALIAQQMAPQPGRTPATAATDTRSLSVPPESAGQLPAATGETRTESPALPPTALLNGR